MLAQELAPFGVHVTLVEPRMYARDFIGASMHLAEFNEAYHPVRAELMERYRDAAPGDPARVAEALITLVDNPKPPRRLLVGDGEFDVIFDVYRARLAEWSAWEKVSRAAG